MLNTNSKNNFLQHIHIASLKQHQENLYKSFLSVEALSIKKSSFHFKPSSITNSTRVGGVNLSVQHSQTISKKLCNSSQAACYVKNVNCNSPVIRILAVNVSAKNVNLWFSEMQKRSEICILANDCKQPSHSLFSLSPYGKRYRGICCHTTTARSSLNHQAVKISSVNPPHPTG